MNESSPMRQSLRRHMIIMLVTAILLAGGLGGWAATAEFAGAVIASGQLVVNSDLKKVQHLTGGIVAELNVTNGDHVEAGQVLIRLDDTQTRANLAIVSKGLDELIARQAREEAERDGAASVNFPQSLLDRMDNAEVAKLVNAERKQFEIRAAALNGQRAQLRERIAQMKEEISGDEVQISSKDNQIGWITKELVGVNDLWEKNLIPYTRVTSLERDKERLAGERGALVASTAQVKGKIAETKLQIIQLDENLRADVGKDLADIRGKSAELVEKKVAAEDLLRRVDIRAPQSGMVHQLSVHTVGGVITAGEPIMYIVPEKDALEVEAKIAPMEIEQLRLGQPATLRFTAFNVRSTPEINGVVNRISADVTQDEKTGASFYTVRIAVPDTELALLGHAKLVPGMPVDCFIKTNPRTVLTYLVRPVHDQLVRVFREK